jgi:Short C-terminal domain
MFRRRRPLLRGAAVGAAGYAVGKRVEERRLEDEAAGVPEEAAGVPEDGADGEVSGGLTDETMEQLRKLGQLKDDGVLTQEEFDEQKRILLGSA